MNGATDKLKTCRHGGSKPVGAVRVSAGRIPLLALRDGMGWDWMGWDGMGAGLDGDGLGWGRTHIPSGWSGYRQDRFAVYNVRPFTSCSLPLVSPCRPFLPKSAG